MLHPVSLLVLVALAAPPSSKTPPPPPPPAPAAAPAPPTLAEAIVKAAGGPVLLVATPAGLEARTPDGRVVRRLTSGPVAQAALDPALDLVWLSGEGRLGVVDLRAPTGAPDAPAMVVPIATGLPPDRPFTVQRARFRKQPASFVASSDGREDDWIELAWGARPAIRAKTLGMWEDEGPAPSLAIVGGAWLKAERERPARPDRPAPRLVDAALRVAPPATLASCGDADLCGQAAPFGPGGWRLVLTSHECGDFCYIGCLLRDPASKRWAVPDERLDWVETPANTGSCGPYLFDPAQTRWAVGELLCSAAGCTELGGRALGWLPPGPQVGH